MTDIDVSPFSFEGKQYEVRVWSDSTTIHVQAFHEGKPANGYSYHVDIIKAFDIRKLTGQNIVKEWIELAKDDIKKRRHERLLEAIELLSKQ